LAHCRVHSPQCYRHSQACAQKQSCPLGRIDVRSVR
jgi:hypothetical protein